MKLTPREKTSDKYTGCYKTLICRSVTEDKLEKHSLITQDMNKEVKITREEKIGIDSLGQMKW